MGKVLETGKKIDNVLNYHLNGETNGVMFNDVSLLRKPIGIGTKSYGFLEAMLYKNIGSHDFKFDGYSTIIGMNSNPYLTNEFNPWFMTDENRIKYDNYLSYINGVYFCGTMMGPNFSDVSNKLGLMDYSALLEMNTRVGVMHSYDMSKIMSARSLMANGATNPNGYDDTRLGVINNFYLSSQLYNAYNEQKKKITSSYNLETIGDGGSFSITKGGYAKFGFGGSHGIKDGEWVFKNDGVINQTVISDDLFDLTKSNVGDLDLKYSSKFINKSGEKTKEFIFKSIYGIDLLSSTSVPLSYEEFNDNNSVVSSKKYLPKKNNTYLDVITESYNFNEYRYDLVNVGNYTKRQDINFYYEEPDVTVEEKVSNGNYIQKITLNDKKKDIISYTNELFKQSKIKTLIGRHSTGKIEDGDQLSSSVSSYGMSHGRNLLKKNHTNGDAYCRVWTYLKQYQRYKDLIRPFNDKTERGLSDALITSKLQIGRNYLTGYGVKGKNGLVRFGPNIKEDITKCMFSIENLAYKHENFTNTNWVQGDNGGRIMWFPPYDLNFNENLKANWSSASFVGRGEKIYSYVDSERSGTLSFSMLIDHPSIINAIRKQNNTSAENDNDENMLLRFFAGCDIINVPDKKDEEKKIVEKGNNDKNNATSENEETINLEFSVYFPNAYSGIKELSDGGNGADWVIHYLCSGVGIGYDGYTYYVQEDDETYTEVGGYEMCYDPKKIKEIKKEETYTVYDDNNNTLSDVYVIKNSKLMRKSDNEGKFSCGFSDGETVFLLKEGYKPIQISDFNKTSFTFKEKDEKFKKYEVNVVDKDENPVNQSTIRVTSCFDGKNNIEYEVPTDKEGNSVILSYCHDSFLEVKLNEKVVGRSDISDESEEIIKIIIIYSEQSITIALFDSKSYEEISGATIKNFRENKKAHDSSNGKYVIYGLEDGELLKVTHPLYKNEDIIYHKGGGDVGRLLSLKDSFNLKVKVLDKEGKAIDGVKVTIDGTDADTGKTDSDGMVIINNISSKNVFEGNDVYVIAKKKDYLTVKKPITEKGAVKSSEITITLTKQTKIDKAVIKIDTNNTSSEYDVDYDKFKFYIDGNIKKYKLEDGGFILRNVKIPTNLEIQHAWYNTKNITIEKEETQVDVTLKNRCEQMTLEIFSSILGDKFKCENINIKFKDKKEKNVSCHIKLEDMLEGNELILEGDKLVISKKGFEEYTHVITDGDIENKKVDIDLMPSDRQDVTFYVCNQNDIPLFNCTISDVHGKKYLTDKNGCCVINVILGSTVTVGCGYFNKKEQHTIAKGKIIDGKYKIKIDISEQIETSHLTIFGSDNGIVIKSDKVEIRKDDDNTIVDKFNIGANIKIVSTGYKDEIIKCYNDVAKTPIMLTPKVGNDTGEGVVKFMMRRSTSNNDEIGDNKTGNKETGGTVNTSGTGNTGDTGEKSYYGISCSKNANITDNASGATVYRKGENNKYIEMYLKNLDYLSGDEVEYYAYRRDYDRNSSANSENRYDSRSFGLNVIPKKGEDNNTTYCSFLDIVAARDLTFTNDVLMKRASLKEILDSRESQIKNIKKLFEIYKIKEFNVTGYATKSGPENQNEELAKNRGKVIQEWLCKDLSKDKFKVDVKKGGILNGGNSCNDLSEKQGRCANVKICFSTIESTGEVQNTVSDGQNKQENTTQEVRINNHKNHYNEYEFFEYVSQDDNFLRHQIIDKIKYFDPAFHSITPEGFNSRLTFLHQCTRQGPTNSASDPKKTNERNISNLSFGSPPICVLRIGDFYNTKIVIDSISIDYSESTWDLNSEGIGVMPMMAAVTINFNFIGGSDLTGPINRLQNAISSNYYANTSVYDKNSIKKK